MACIIIFLMGCLYYVRYVYLKRLKNQMTASELARKQLEENEKNLTSQLNALQAKFNNATHDPVTGLPGQSLFVELVQHSITESARYHFALAVLYIDIEDFDVIYQSLGYEASHVLLSELSRRFSACIRQVDCLSVINNHTFAVLLTQLSKPETAAIVAQRILESAIQALQVQSHTLFTSVCIGIAVYPQDGQGSDALFECAYQALQRAKSKGKQTYQFYQQEIHSNSMRDLSVLMGLKQASFKHSLKMNYCPIWDIKNNAIFCVEVKPNWLLPGWENIDEKTLIQYTEIQGQLDEVTEQSLKMGCAQFFHWESIGLHPNRLGIHVTLKQLMSYQFIYRLTKTLQNLHFNPKNILFIVQYTQEQIIWEKLEKALNMLEYLQIKIILEGFGVSKFSLYDLRKIPFSYLKLDPRLIDDSESAAQDLSFIQAIAGMAESLSMQLIFQGVDSESKLLKVKSLKGELLQGEWADKYYFKNEAFTITNK
jgi:diguanylate cyclase (GGDEF)-like protein